MASELIRTYSKSCQCEVVSSSAIPSQSVDQVVRELQLTPAQFKDRKYLQLKVRDGELEASIVSPPDSSKKVQEHVITVSKTRRAEFDRVRLPTRWESSQSEYLKVLELMLHGTKKSPGYGRSKSFDEKFRINAVAPHWITIATKETGHRLDIRVNGFYSHLHPQRELLRDLPIPDAAKNQLSAAGFSLKSKLDLYYFETHGRSKAEPDNKGWIVIDQGRIAGWSKNHPRVQLGRFNPEPTVFELR